MHDLEGGHDGHEDDHDDDHFHHGDQDDDQDGAASRMMETMERVNNKMQRKVRSSRGRINIKGR